jgi:hypothetical protein
MTIRTELFNCTEAKLPKKSFREMWRGLHHSNSNITISGFDKRRKGGPRVSALLEVNTYISRTLPITDVLSQFHSSSKRADVKPIESGRNLSVNAFHEKAGRGQGNSVFFF